MKIGGVRILAMALTLAGCAAPPPPSTTHAFKPPDRIRVLASPKELREDYTYPAARASQTLRWSDSSPFEWRIKFAPGVYSYGGVVLRRPLSFTQAVDRTVMIFYIQPAAAAAKLSLGLVDGDAVAPHVLVDTPLVVTEDAAKKPVAEIRVPLSAFSRDGVSVSDESGAAPFDWSDVREVRFIANGAQPRREIVITKLRFEK